MITNRSAQGHSQKQVGDKDIAGKKPGKGKHPLQQIDVEAMLGTANEFNKKHKGDTSKSGKY